MKNTGVFGVVYDNFLSMTPMQPFPSRANWLQSDFATKGYDAISGFSDGLILIGLFGTLPVWQQMSEKLGNFMADLRVDFSYNTGNGGSGSGCGSGGGCGSGCGGGCGGGGCGGCGS